MKVSPKNGCINKTETIAISIDMLTWKEKITSAQAWTKNYRQLLMPGRRRISLLGMRPLMGCTTQSGHPYTHHQQKQIQQVFISTYTYISPYTGMCICNKYNQRKSCYQLERGHERIQVRVTGKD